MAEPLEQIEIPPQAEVQNRTERRNKRRRAIFTILAIVLIIVGLLVALGFAFPDRFLVIVNILWIVLVALVVLFLFLGVLVMIGLKKQAGEILNFLLEGSLRMIDLADFVRAVIESFLKLLRDFILFITPLLGIAAAAVGYFGLIFLYKDYGRENDVTGLTVALTAGLILFVGILNRPQENPPTQTTWLQEIGKKFLVTFRDALEVAIFVFFLTMDSTNLFFLPTHLRIPLHAEYQGYDLMLREFVLDQDFRTSLTLIIIAIGIEVVRNILKVVVGAVKYYKQGIQTLDTQMKDYRTADVVKWATRQSFNTLKDDLIKFITFTTVLILVFLLFPRLKILAMAVTSVTALLLDILMPARLRVERQQDLISKIIFKVFGL